MRCLVKLDAFELLDGIVLNGDGHDDGDEEGDEEGDKIRQLV